MWHSQGALLTHRNFVVTYSAGKALEVENVSAARVWHLVCPVSFICSHSWARTRRSSGFVTHKCTYTHTRRQFPDDVHFSYLPLPHVFERVMLIAVLGNGAAMGFWQVSERVNE